MKQVLLSQPLRFDAMTARGCLRVWTQTGESHLVPSGWLTIPEHGWLVIEVLP